MILHRDMDAFYASVEKREGFQLGDSETGADNPPALLASRLAASEGMGGSLPANHGTHQRRSCGP